MHKHIPKLVLAIILFVFWRFAGGESVLGVPVAHAALLNPVLTQTVNLAHMTVGLFITILNTLAWVLLYFLDILLDPEMVLSTTTEGVLPDVLYKLWVFSRDIVNIAFVFILIAGAVWTIVTANYEKLKAAAPTFVIALILVNFSWFIPRVVMDVANVLTDVVYRLPDVMPPGGCMVETLDKSVTPPVMGFQECEVVVDIAFFDKATAAYAYNPIGWKCPLPDYLCYYSQPYSQAIAAGKRSSGVLSGLVVNYAMLRYLTLPDVSPAAGSPEVTALITLIQMAVVLLIHVALFFPLLAMVAAFMLRIPVIWITIAFMPFVALGYALKGNAVLGEHDPVKMIMNNFLQAVFLPVLVGIPLVIGFVMLRAVDPSAMAATRLFSELDSKEFHLLIAVQNLGALFWLLMALAVMWVGVFAVLKKQQISAGITGAIEGYGKMLGQLALKAPLSVPMLPAPGGGPKISPLQALKMPQTALSEIEATGSMKGVKAAMERLKGGGTSDATSAQIADALRENRHTEVTNKIDIKISAMRDKSGDALSRAFNELKEEYKRQQAEHGGAEAHFANAGDDSITRALEQYIQDKAPDVDRALDALGDRPSAPAAGGAPGGGPAAPAI